MDGASEDPVWKTRRAVLAVLLVVGIVTTGYAFVATRSGDEPTTTATDTAPDEVVTAVRPSDGHAGPLRLGKILVVGRFGDPVAKPEGTAESYADAIDAGVDYVEAEVVMTKDDKLVVRDSNALRDTTDVAEHPEFADRETTKTIDGAERTDWFTEDFTLAELRTLRAVETKPSQRPDSASHDGDYAVLGFDDLVTQVKDASKEAGRDIGIFVRPLRPSYFRDLDLPIEPAIVKSLTRSRLVQDPERVTVESPDTKVLQRIEDSGGIVGRNVLTAYVIPAGSADELDEVQDLAASIDAVAVEVGAFAGLDVADVCALGDRVHEADKALMVYPVSYENALLGNFASKTNPDPGAPGNLSGLLRGLRDLGTDVILAESPTEVMTTLADLPTDQKSLCG